MNPILRNVFFIQISSFAIAIGSAWGQSADWPQWRGPHRDGKSASESLMKQWPEQGPALRWTFRDCGIGYSAFSVVGNRLFTLGLKDGKCFAICVDTQSGSQVWQTAIDQAPDEEAYLHGWGGGPRSTPTVDGEHLYALSDGGTLACLKASGGDLVWKISLVDDFGGSIPKWGYSESPLIDGDRVVVTPGGKNFMVALDKKTGKQVWGSKGVDTEAQYVSIIKHTIDGITFYVTAAKPGLLAFDSTSGEQVFADTATANGVAVIPTPIVEKDKVYHTSAYDAGNTLIKLSKAKRWRLESRSSLFLI